MNAGTVERGDGSFVQITYISQEDKMKLLYKIEDINKLKKYELAENTEIRSLKIPDDLFLLYLFHKDRKPDIVFNEKEMIENYQQWYEKGCIYYILLVDERIVATAAIEKYSNDKWEAADVRVLRSERNKGYGKQIVYFVTKCILDHGITATCYTEDDNIPMQKVINSLGFTPYE